MSLGIFYGVLSVFFSTLMNLFVKLIGNGVSTPMLIFSRFLISLLLLLPFLIYRKSFGWRKTSQGKLLFRTVVALLALATLFYAVRNLPLANAILLNTTSPLFIPLIVFATSGVKTSKGVIVGLLIGFLGVIVMLNPVGGAFLEWVSLVGLVSGFLTGVAYVQIRRLSKTHTPDQLLFYYFLYSVIISGLCLPIGWVTPKVGEIWVYLLLVGIFGTLYQIFITYSFVCAPVRLMSCVVYLGVVFGAVADALIWHQVPSISTILGMILVISGGILSLITAKKGQL